jgi:hypothetical protein
MKKYKLPKGSVIYRYDATAPHGKRYTEFVTSKDAYYTHDELIMPGSKPKSYAIRLPLEAWPFTKIRVDAFYLETLEV